MNPMQAGTTRTYRIPSSTTAADWPALAATVAPVIPDRLPDPPAHAGEPIAHYGARLFRFVLATGVTATLTDTQLELAIMAGARASATVARADGALADRLSACRHQLAHAQRVRVQLAGDRARVLAGLIGDPDPDRPSSGRDGSPARLVPDPRPLSPVAGMAPDDDTARQLADVGLWPHARRDSVRF